MGVPHRRRDSAPVSAHGHGIADFNLNRDGGDCGGVRARRDIRVCGRELRARGGQREHPRADDVGGRRDRVTRVRDRRGDVAGALRVCALRRGSTDGPRARRPSVAVGDGAG